MLFSILLIGIVSQALCLSFEISKDITALRSSDDIYFQNMTEHGYERVSVIRKSVVDSTRCGPGYPRCKHGDCCSGFGYCGSGNSDANCKCPGCIDYRVSECGKINPEARIVGGHRTKAHEYPWMASIVHRKFSRTKYRNLLCGGSTLSKKWILTAAHCFYYRKGKNIGLTVKNSKVILGHHNIFGQRKKQHFPKRIIRHRGFKAHDGIEKEPNFSNDGYALFANDIALIELEKPVEFGTSISHVCLTAPTKQYVDTDVTAIGYGRQGNGQYSDFLNEVKLSTISNNVCRGRKGLYKNIPSSMICAWHPQKSQGKKDTCVGDSGGPLMTLENNKYVQIGITSLGPPRCGQKGLPNVNTRVSEYLPWIRKNTLPENKKPYEAIVYWRKKF